MSRQKMWLSIMSLMLAAFFDRILLVSTAEGQVLTLAITE
jgi:hypothetical protein